MLQREYQLTIRLASGNLHHVKVLWIEESVLQAYLPWSLELLKRMP